jgi:hypothetical protein
MSDPVERLQDYTLAHQHFTITLATAVVGALAFDAANGTFDLGACSTWLFRTSVLMFALSGLCGGFVSAKLATTTEEYASTIFEERYRLLHFGTVPILTLRNGTWRTAQHWFLWIGIVLAAFAGVLARQAPTCVPY